MELNAGSRLIEAATEKRLIGEYVTKNGEPAITIYQEINDKGRVQYRPDIMHDKFSCPPFHDRSDYREVYTKVTEELKRKRGWKAIKPLPEHEPSTHVEPTHYEFHVEFLDENGRMGKLDHAVKARNRFDAFAELLQGLKRSGGMEVVHRITCTASK
jgi:hypothetical protein